jgi:hypothetical protein
MITQDVLNEFDRFLEKRGIRAELLIVGGTALQLMGLRTIATQDVDAISQINDTLRVAVREFATLHALPTDWINDRARITLLDYLMHGYGVDQVSPVFSGRALTLVCPSRENLILSKFCALVDRGSPQDLADLQGLVKEAISNEKLAELIKYFLSREGATGGDTKKAEAALAVVTSLLSRP